MTGVKSIEGLAESEKSWEDALQRAVTEAARTVPGIKSVSVKEFQATVDHNKITRYRVACKIMLAQEEAVQAQ